MQIFTLLSLGLCTIVALAGIAVSAIDSVIVGVDQVGGDFTRLLNRLESFNNRNLRVKRSPDAANADPESQLGKGNDNKVSELLHFIHRTSSKVVFRKPKKQSSKKGPKNDQADGGQEVEEPDYKSMTDKELFETICDQGNFVGLCNKATAAALRRNPEEGAKIAQAIREKPDYVDARKLLAHKLLETGIMKAEAKGYDKALDKAITFAATKNPYAYGAIKAIDLTRKLT